MPEFSRTRLTVLALFSAVTLSVVAQTNNSQSSAAPRPRFERDEERVHDPSTTVKCKDEYWVLSTGPGIGSRHSTNLVKWSDGPRVFETAPPFTSAIPGNRGYFWAPDVIRLKQGYFLYYSVSTWGKNNSAIALATNSTLDPAAPEFRWVDRG